MTKRKIPIMKTTPASPPSSNKAENLSDLTIKVGLQRNYLRSLAKQILTSPVLTPLIPQNLPPEIGFQLQGNLNQKVAVLVDVELLNELQVLVNSIKVA